MRVQRMPDDHVGEMTCDQESVRTNALVGFWYDAMACVCSLIERVPA